MKTMMHIGAATKETVEAARETILKILSTPRGDAVVEKALDAFTAVCEVKANVSNCTFDGRSK